MLEKFLRRTHRRPSQIQDEPFFPSNVIFWNELEKSASLVGEEWIRKIDGEDVEDELFVDEVRAYELLDLQRGI